MHATANSPRNSASRWMRSLLLALICATCALAMTSCATGTAATKDSLRPAAPSPPPGLQANQRQQCPPLPLARHSGPLELARNHDEVTDLYRQCGHRVDSLLQAFDEWERTAWGWYCASVLSMGLKAEGCPRETK